MNGVKINEDACQTSQCITRFCESYSVFKEEKMFRDETENAGILGNHPVKLGSNQLDDWRKQAHAQKEMAHDAFTLTYLDLN